MDISAAVTTNAAAAAAIKDCLGIFRASDETSQVSMFLPVKMPLSTHSVDYHVKENQWEKVK